jgi:N6-adenosine-specific RNA methylase IME4
LSLELNKKYKVIYADPPWQYKDKSKSHGGGAESHYSCMSTEDIAALPVKNIADTDSVLLMWVTYPMLEEAFKIIPAWGFKFKTVAFTWVKCYLSGGLVMGMGRYTRANAEICILATRGKGCPRVSKCIKNTQIHPLKEHSKKPGAFRNDIVRLFGDVPRIEIFSRERIEGWDVFGNEIPDTMQKHICGLA